MTKRKKSLWLQLFVFLIIFVLLFSVIGVVVVYLRGIQEQAIYTVPVTTTPNDEAVTIIPKWDGAFTVTDTTAENTEEETIDLVVWEDGTIEAQEDEAIELDIEGEVNIESDNDEPNNDAAIEAEGEAEVEGEAETENN